MVADLANSMQLFDLFALRHQLKHAVERLLLEGTTKGRDHDDLALLSCILGKWYHLMGSEKTDTYIRVELAFIDANYVPFLPLIPDFSKLADGDGLLLDPKQLVRGVLANEDWIAQGIRRK